MGVSRHIEKHVCIIVVYYKAFIKLMVFVFTDFQ